MRTPTGFWYAQRTRPVAALLCCIALSAAGALAQPGADPGSNTSTVIDFNQASEAELDSLRGVGPATTRRILQARAERPFSDWADLTRRVRGIGHTSAASFSSQGFVVNGAPYPLHTAPGATR